MQINELLKLEDDSIYRLLSIKEDKVLLINCNNLTMPKWMDVAILEKGTIITKAELLEATDKYIPKSSELSIEQLKEMQKRFTLITPILAHIEKGGVNYGIIDNISKTHKISKQTIRKYLCLFLAYSNMAVLAPYKKETPKVLTEDEKNYRWALNKYYYTMYKHSLRTTYLYLLRDKYTNDDGNFVEPHPTFRQFYYFYTKNKSLQTYYISRDGLSHYQRENRPLLGEVRDFAPTVGVGMLDSTICDIYLVDECNNVIGRPILSACIDAYSGMCLGYYLGWEGGLYSVQKLLLNVVSDKVEHCKNKGVSIKENEWDCSQLPATLVTDMGTEYKSATLEHLTELGVNITNLSPYRPDLKSPVEKFFDIIQNLYKPELKGKGVIEPDFQERGGHDYRKDACITLEKFEQIIINSILYHNNHRISKALTVEMMKDGVKPYVSAIWEYGKQNLGANLLSIDKQLLSLCLLPRTKAKFTRSGLVVNNLRYKADNFTEEFLQEKECLVAYNPDNVGTVWLIDKGKYIPFKIILSEYNDKSLDDVTILKKAKSSIIKEEIDKSFKAKIDLINKIGVIALNSGEKQNANILDVRKSRTKEIKKTHEDLIGAIDEETN